MDRRRLKFGLLGAGIVVTMGFLLFVGITSSGGFVYYLTVSEFLRQGPRPDNDNFRINGKVAPGSIDRQAGGSRVLFDMAEGGAVLRVDFEGVIPDTFVDEADVVVHGQLRPDGTFKADQLLAKCPSKYEAAAEEGQAAPHPEKQTGSM